MIRARRNRPGGSARTSRLCVLALLLLALLPSLHPVLARGDARSGVRPAAATPEQRDAATVQAVFLYNFAARHVKWPDSAHKESKSPFVIGILGEADIRAPLEATCKGRKSGEHPIQVRVLDEAADAASCHILFVPKAREGELDEVVEACQRRPTLIVTESEATASRGAHIAFFLEKSKVRFAIEPDRPKGVGLEISSELLKLARIVDKDEGGAR